MRTIKCCVDGATEELLTIKIKMKLLFYSILFAFRNSNTSWTDSRRQVDEDTECVTVGMMNSQSTRRKKPVPVPICPTIISRELSWDRTWASGTQLTNEPHFYFKYLARTAQWTPRLCHKNRSCNAVERYDLCPEIHIKHIHAVCGQNIVFLNVKTWWYIRLPLSHSLHELAWL
jgi:hypothetical protein